MESVPIIGVRRLTRFESVKKKAATGHAKCRCHAATEHIWKCHQRPFLPSCTLCFCSRLPSVHILTRCLSTKDSSLELFILWEGFCCICNGQIKVKNNTKKHFIRRPSMKSRSWAAHLPDTLGKTSPSLSPTSSSSSPSPSWRAMPPSSTTATPVEQLITMKLWAGAELNLFL